MVAGQADLHGWVSAQGTEGHHCLCYFTQASAPASIYLRVTQGKWAEKDNKNKEANVFTTTNVLIRLLNFILGVQILKRGWTEQ